MKVMIGIPMHQGTITAQTMQSVMIAASKQNKMQFQLLGLSLLAKNFNLLFINAIKLGFDFFILHHADIGVVGRLTRADNLSWLDTMVNRVQQYKLAALSVVSPIKSDNGLTSSGLEMVKDDPWSLRRVTMKELDRLPTQIITRGDMCKVFDADCNTAGALLINTGVLIMDIRDRGGVWREKQWPGFGIYDEISWNTKGIPESFTIPEDWAASSWMHNNNVPYACTKEILITHIGSKNYLNHGNWGDPSDGPRQQLNPQEYEKT